MGIKIKKERGMNIKLDDKYYLMGNSMSYMLMAKDKDKKGNIIYRNVGYYTNIGAVLKSYIDLKCRTNSNITSIKKLMSYLNAIIVELNKTLIPLKINIVKKLK